MMTTAQTVKPKLLMLKGLPASGKSTYARELVEKEGYVRVNKDDLRNMVDNGVWSRENEERIIRARDQIIMVSVAAGKSVVVDDTNFAPKHKQDLEALATTLSADFEVLFIDTPLEECIRRNERRADKVPVEVIYGMYDKYIAPFKNKPLEQDPNLDECIIVDIDGTLAHITGENPRSPYDASRAMEDTLDDAVSNIVAMAYGHGYRVILFTGRKEKHLEVTREWLKKHDVSYDDIYCRGDEDNRPDYELKEELYRQHVEGKYFVKYIIDDRPQVCRMWRRIGHKVLQVGDPHVEF